MKKNLIPILYFFYALIGIVSALIPIKSIINKKILIGSLLISIISVNSGCKAKQNQPSCHFAVKSKRHEKVETAENYSDSISLKE